MKYAERVIASKDEQVKTNAGTVIEICLNINKKLDEQIREDEAMHKTIRVFSYPSEIRRVIYTTNAIESLNGVIRSRIKTKRRDCTGRIR